MRNRKILKQKLTPSQESRLLRLILLLVLIAFSWLLFAPNTGFLSMLHQRSELKALQQETQVLREKNEKLQQDIHRIENDQEYLEEVARRDYDMIKDDEILFDFSKKKKKQE